MRPGTRVRHRVWKELAGVVIHDDVNGEAQCVRWDQGWPEETEIVSTDLIEVTGGPAGDLGGGCACLAELLAGRRGGGSG